MHLGAHRGGAQRHIARGDALGQAPHVGVHTPEPGAKHLAGAAEAGHHLVGNQQHAMTVAHRADQRPVVLGRHDDAAGALHRLGDEGGHGVGALEDDLALQQLGAEPAQFGGVLRVGVVVQPGRVDVEAARQQRLVGAAEVAVAVHAHAAKVHAVVALAQADELGAVGLAAQLVVLAGDLQRAFHRVRAAVAEHHRGHAFGLHQRHQPGRELDGLHVRGAAERVVERQRVHLRDHRVAHRLVAVPQVGAPEAAHAVEQLVAVHVPDPAAFAAGNDVGRRRQHGLGVGHGVPDVLAVVGFERGDVGGVGHVQLGVPTMTVFSSV